MKAVAWVGRNTWTAALVLVVGIVAPALAGDGRRERESLTGLAGVYVLVEGIDPDVEREGLTRSTIQTDVEVKLRQAGIRVITRTESLVALGSPYVYVRVTMLSLREVVPLYAVAALLELNQEVMLARDPTIALSTSTWSTSWVGAAGGNKLDWVREKVRDQVDKFINAYLSANPKR